MISFFTKSCSVNEYLTSLSWVKKFRQVRGYFYGVGDLTSSKGEKKNEPRLLKYILMFSVSIDSLDFLTVKAYTVIFSSSSLSVFSVSLRLSLVMTYSLSMAFGKTRKCSINVNVKSYSSFCFWNCWCEKNSTVFYLNKVCFNLDWLAVNCLVREAKGSG